HTWQIGAAANRLFRRPVDKPLGLGADYSIAATCPSGYWTRRPWTHPSIATARAPYPAPQARRSEGGSRPSSSSRSGRSASHVKARVGGVPRRSHNLMRAGLSLTLLLVLLSLERDLVGLAPAAYRTGVRFAVVGAAALAGGIAVRSGVAAVTIGLGRRAGALWRNLATWTMYSLLGLWAGSCPVRGISALLVGGAVLGVVAATASQASLGNFFAGLLLMLGRPYRVGSAVRLRGPELGGEACAGTVVDIGALYTTLVTGGGEVLKIPNRAVVTSTLTVGEAPVQAEVDLELPPDQSLRPIEDALRAQLGSAASTITVAPRRLSVREVGMFVCGVEVRAPTALEPALLAEALALAVGRGEPDGRGEPR